MDWISKIDYKTVIKNFFKFITDGIICKTRLKIIFAGRATAFSDFLMVLPTVLNLNISQIYWNILRPAKTFAPNRVFLFALLFLPHKNNENCVKRQNAKINHFRQIKLETDVDISNISKKSGTDIVKNFRIFYRIYTG